MMEETRTLVTYRLERAEESLQEAKLLLEKGHGNTYVNRLYYACFYAVSAFLLARGLSSAKHSGIRAMFHKELVRPGLLAIEHGQLYDKLFDNRQKGDYADLVRFDLAEVGKWFDETKRFVAAVTKIAEKEMEKA